MAFGPRNQLAAWGRQDLLRVASASKRPQMRQRCEGIHTAFATDRVI